MKKTIALLLFLTALSGALVSCNQKPAYADGVPCSGLTDAVIQALPSSSGYSAYGRDQIEFFFEDTKIPDDYSLIYSTASADIDEIGVFHAPDAASAAELQSIVQRYIDDMRLTQTSFIASYAPEELPKLENAEVKLFGNYVVYIILSDEDRNLAYSEIERVLKENI